MGRVELPLGRVPGALEAPRRLWEPSRGEEAAEAEAWPSAGSYTRVPHSQVGACCPLGEGLTAQSQGRGA